MLFQEQPEDEDGLFKILTYDHMCRQIEYWPLLPVSDTELNKYTVKQEKKDVTMSSRLIIDNNVSIGKWNLKWEKDFNDNYPLCSLLLQKYSGKLAVAGGSLIRSLIKLRDTKSTKTDTKSTKTDVDIFFYNTNEKEAQDILIDCVSIISSYENIDLKNIIIERKKYVTTVRIFTDSDETVYQFIHRIYPRLDLIPGGFDIGPSMFVYDGNNIYGTPLGLWSLMKRSIIVDVSRRSVSFTQRLLKYKKIGFNIIFPDITVLDIQKFKEFTNEKYYNKFKEYYNKLKNVFKQNFDESKVLPYKKYYILKLPGKLYIKIYDKTFDIKSRIKNVSDYQYKSYPYNKVNNVFNKSLMFNVSEYGIFTYISYDNVQTYDDVFADFTKLIDNPDINKHININHIIRFIDPIKVKGVTDNLIQDKVKLYEKELTGLRWHTQNPGKQWTSSINPIYENPKDFYGKFSTPLIKNINPQYIKNLTKLVNKKYKV